MAGKSGPGDRFWLYWGIISPNRATNATRAIIIIAYVARIPTLGNVGY